MGHQHGQQHIRTVAGDNDDAAFDEAREHVLHRHARDDDAECFALQQRRVALDQGAVACRHEGGDVRRGEQRVFRDRPDRNRLAAFPTVGGCRAQRRDDLVEPVGLGPIRDHPDHVGVRRVQFLHGQAEDLAQFVRTAVTALIRLPAEHEQNRCTQVRGDARVV